MFVYAGDRAQAEAAEGKIRSVAAEHGWDIEIELKHWHPTAEEWEDPDKPLPTTDAERLAEHQELLAQEREDSDIRGYPEYEVRIECPSHHDTVKLDKRLHDEGFPTVRRWKYLLVGADDEDSANALAERLRAEVPQGTHGYRRGEPAPDLRRRADPGLIRDLRRARRLNASVARPTAATRRRWRRPQRK